MTEERAKAEAVAWRYKTTNGWVVTKTMTTSNSEPLVPASVVAALEAEVARLRADAERYRKLRVVTPYRFKALQDACTADATDTLYFLGEKFDAAIDSLTGATA